MKLIFNLFAALFFLAACQKDGEQLAPKCGKLSYVATTYDSAWKVVEVLTTDFGTVCGGEFEYYREAVKKQSELGEWLCPPVRQYGKWYIIY